MMFRQVWLWAAALPAVALAGSANDIYYTGDGTGNAWGQAAAVTCNSGIADNYVALNTDQWNSTQNCNKCVEVSCDDDRCSDQTSSVTVYVVGECSECEDEGLDLSPTVFKKLTGSAPARYTIKWEFTECPASDKSSFNQLKSGSGNYQAGKVEAADESQKKVSILQANEEGVEKQKEETEQANTKSEANNVATSTSPFIVVLVVLAAVCVMALAAVAYTAKRKKHQRDECVTKSFDTFSSPLHKKAAIAKI